MPHALLHVLFTGLFLVALRASAEGIEFNRDIRPILSDHCYACHGPDEGARKAGLRLDQRDSAFHIPKSGLAAIAPGKPNLSGLISRVISEDPDEVMPPPEHGKPLDQEQIRRLQQWVQEGAIWSDHWAFVPPTSINPPDAKNPSDAHALDLFIQKKLTKAGFSPAPEAPKSTLLRRVMFDLTGLPPTPEEVDAFLADTSPNAYNSVVDRLLGSNHYGERMALNWLDLARYADTSGYHFDGVRFMWLWRDWVIRAFNENKPFDVFTIEQLAGDLLPNPTQDQRIATGFMRNNMTNDEGGADPDEYLNKYVADRVNTFGNVWLGMTVACAECHDHKFDPIKIKEYYQLYSFFHNVPEKGLDRIRTDNPPPRLPVPTPEQALQFVEADFRLRDAEKTLQDRTNELGETQEKWERETLDAAKDAKGVDDWIVRLALDDSFDLDLPQAPIDSPTTPAFSGVVANPTPSVPQKVATYQRDDPPHFTPGRLGKALNFDGRMHLNLGSVVEFDSTTPFSISSWIRTPAKGAIVSKMEPGPGYQGFDLLLNDHRFEIHLIHKFPENAIKVRTKERFDGPAWRHVLVTYDGSGKAAGVALFVDGKNRALDLDRDSLQGSFLTAQPLRVGSRHGDTHFNGEIDDLRFYDRQLGPEDAAALVMEGIRTIVATSRGQRSEEDRNELHRFYKENHAVDYLRAVSALAEARDRKNGLFAAIPTTLIMEEMVPPRDTHLLIRGDFRSKGERVLPGTPAFLPPIRKVIARNQDGHIELNYAKDLSDSKSNSDSASAASPDWLPSRLDLAAWLVSPEHPLTARVTVNRYWALLFGTGLVATLNDLGSQGEWPSHLELLDWLACRFRDGEPHASPPVQPWDVKELIRLIVTSETYRQSSHATPKKREWDPYNRLLTRGPRLQLEAEFIRDNALAISGLLNTQIGGPSVKPYQPPGIWDGTDSVFVQDHGEDLYRRGLYVFWRRSAHYPPFATFDAPNREVCTFSRQRTQTPLQSLVLMNDPAFVECARNLAQRVFKEEPHNSNKRLVRAFRLTLGRTPEPDELASLQKGLESQLEGFGADTDSAMALLKVGESSPPDDIDPVELAAWTAIANVLLNLNETITK